MTNSSPLVRTASVSVAVLCGVTSACGITGVAPDEARLSGLVVTPGIASVPAGKPQQFVVAYGLSSGIAAAIPPAGASLATWVSSDPSVATIDASGRATTLKPGSVTMTATSGPFTATARLTVMDTVTGAVLQSITVGPAVPGMTSTAKGLTVQLQATGHYSDGSTLPLTMASWTSANPLVATVGDTGLVTGTGVGLVEISASVTPAGVTAALGGSFTVNVLPATLVSIGVTPPAPLIVTGTTQAFTATGIYSDLSTRDLTASVTWATTLSSIATFGLVGGMPNVVSGLLTGSTGVTATLDGIVGEASLAVAQATLSSIEISPDDASLAAGTIQQLSATGIYSDGTLQDITSLVNWSSALPALATVSTTSGSKGLVTAVATGTAGITASLGAVTATVPVVVTAASLTSITIGPALPTLAAGASLQLSATGIYSDHSTQNLTSQVTWASQQANFASVSIAAGSAGLVTGIAAGNATVTAMFPTPSGSVVGTTAVSVTSATLVSLSIDPPHTTLSSGLSQQLTATGVYSDNSSADLTGAVTWTSSSPTAASVSTGGTTRGVVTALAPGPVTITAALLGISASAKVQVNPATVASITVSASSVALDVGEKLPFTAIASYSDGSTLDVTGQVVWSSSSVMIATVSNAGVSHGVVTGVAAGGPVTVTATLVTDGTAVSGTGQLSVFAATITSIRVTAPSLPTPPSMAAPLTAQLRAIAEYSNGSRLDVTSAASWTSSAPALATVSSVTGFVGVVTAVAPGTATITATYDGNVGTLALAVTTATVTSIVVTPSTLTLALGTYSGLQAEASFSDGTMADVTSQATWVSTNPELATASNDIPYRATLYGVAATPAGTPVRIDATLEGKTASALVTVSTATLMTINIGPASNPMQAINVEVGHDVGLQAVGTFSDSSTQLLRRQVLWTSSNNGFVAVSNAPGSWGELQGVAVTAPGMLPTVTAAWGMISGNTSVTVTQ